jgi:hypothetical protein
MSRPYRHVWTCGRDRVSSPWRKAHGAVGAWDSVASAAALGCCAGAALGCGGEELSCPRCGGSRGQLCLAQSILRVRHSSPSALPRRNRRSSQRLAATKSLDAGRRRRRRSHGVHWANPGPGGVYGPQWTMPPWGPVWLPGRCRTLPGRWTLVVDAGSDAGGDSGVAGILANAGPVGGPGSSRRLRGAPPRPPREARLSRPEFTHPSPDCPPHTSSLSRCMPDGPNSAGELGLKPPDFTQSRATGGARNLTCLR